MNKIIIQIGGKPATLKFTMYAMMQMHGVQKANEYDNIIAMIWGGLQGWWHLNNIEPDITLEDVNDFVEEAMLNNPKVITDINDCMAESNVYKALIKAAETDEPSKKKKQTGAK